MASPAQHTVSATLGELYTLADTHTDTCVVIAPARGALVTSWKVAGRELLYMDDSTLHDTTKNVRGGIPVLFPSPGKLLSDSFAYNGRVGTGLTQHGFARLMPWQVRESSGEALRLGLTSDATTLSRFPWRFRAQLDFAVRERSLQLTFSVENTDSEPMPFALGYHPYFHVHERDKAQVRIDSQASQAFDNVRKQIVAFEGFDLTQPELDLHLLDHDSQQCVLTWPDGSALHIKADPEFVVWVVWTLAGRDFVCLEPWSARGNALNSGHNLLTVEPGHTREIQLDLTFVPAS